jgi:hypothetical protein
LRFDSEGQAANVGRKILLYREHEPAVCIGWIGSDGPNCTRRCGEGDTCNGPVDGWPCRFPQMGHANQRNAVTRGESRQRREQPAHFGIGVGIRAAQVCRDRVNDNETDARDTRKRIFERRYPGFQIEGPLHCRTIG